MFGMFVIFTLFITKGAAAKAKSASDFYTAGGGITGFQNGLAIAGDYMSAASFLGISAAVYLNGYVGLIGQEYWIAVVIVGTLMMVYVLFGGMTATTWVQVIKAIMLLGGASFMAFVVMSQFHFSPEAMFAKSVEIHDKKQSIMGPGTFIQEGIRATLSLCYRAFSIWWGYRQSCRVRVSCL